MRTKRTASWPGYYSPVSSCHADQTRPEMGAHEGGGGGGQGVSGTSHPQLPSRTASCLGTQQLQRNRGLSLQLDQAEPHNIFIFSGALTSCDTVSQRHVSGKLQPIQGHHAQGLRLSLVMPVSCGEETGGGGLPFCFA